MGVETAPPAYNGQAPMQQPVYAQPQQPAGGAQIGCPGCKQVIGIPPGTPPGGQLQCPSCQTVMAVPGGPAAQQAAGPTIVISNNQQVAGAGYQRSDGDQARMLFFIGFCFGFCWIYCFFRYFKSEDPQAVLFARISLCCSVGWVVFVIVLFSGGFVVGGYSYRYYYVYYYYGRR